VAAIAQPERAELVVRHAKRIRWLAVTEHLLEGGEPPASLRPGAESSFSSLDGDAADLRGLETDPWRHGSVQYTSGTTSRPKGVLWTHGNALWGARTSAVRRFGTARTVLVSLVMGIGCSLLRLCRVVFHQSPLSISTIRKCKVSWLRAGRLRERP
jgi:acyl-coenzyme A synthetase/AMP-(fatty) acid ligase